jgi:hypothetical protein
MWFEFGFPFFFRRWWIHAKCLTVPAMYHAGDRIPFDVQGLFGGSKKQFKRFTLDTTPPAHVKVKARLPRQHTGENILWRLLHSSVLSLLSTGFKTSHCPGGE